MTLDDPYVTFDLNNALLSGQGLFQPNYVAMGHFYSIDLGLTKKTPAGPFAQATHYSEAATTTCGAM